MDDIKPITKEVKEFKLNRQQIEKSILKFLNIGIEPDNYNTITATWEIKNNEVFGIFIVAEKIL